MLSDWMQTAAEPFKHMAVEPIVMTPEQASAFVAAEVRKWKTVAAAAKIQVD